MDHSKLIQWKKSGKTYRIGLIDIWESCCEPLRVVKKETGS
jgi:hypothetical protein